MGYVPLFMDMEGKRWLIAGGGAVAARKARCLLPCGAVICVVAPDMDPGLKALSGTGEQEGAVGCLTLKQRCFEDADLKDVDFVIAATGEAALNSRISSMCRGAGIPVNVVDVKEEGSFLFPSIVRDGPVTVGISTEGMSPSIAIYLKARIQSVLPEGLGAFTRQLGILRARVKERFPDSPDIRSGILRELARAGLGNGCHLTQKMADTIIEGKQEQENE